MLDTHSWHFNDALIKEFSQDWPFKIPEKRSKQVLLKSLRHYLGDSIRHKTTWSRHQLGRWSLERLSTLVDWAFDTVPFYHERYKSVGYELGSIRSIEDFKALPMISREDLLQNSPNLLSSIPTEKTSPICSTDFIGEPCRQIPSSGSSGQPVRIVMEQERTIYDTLHRIRMFEMMAGQTFPAKNWLYNINHALWWYTSFDGELPVFTISQRCPTRNIIEHIRQLRPIFISAISSYVDLLSKEGISLTSLGVLGVSCNSETTTIQQRMAWSEQLKVPVLDEYSSEEVGLMAYECRNRYYHAIEDDTYLEIINCDDRGYGEVIGTDLWNHAMPIIRYQQDDLAAWEVDTTPCTCGCTFKRLKAIQGRVDQAFVTKDNKRVLPGQLLELTETYLSLKSAGLKEYLVIQVSHTEVHIKAVPTQEENNRETMIKAFNEAMNEIFGYAITIKVILTDCIDRGESKRRTLVSNI